ncbi:MAG: DUF4339 domain-containing protein [Alphaproteobacteria bacterium]|nr:DUF4339 domain-containing protein [Alphaproteobacteria bacterium]
MGTCQFYVEHKGKIRGPFTILQIQYLAQTNQITPETRIQVGGNVEWQRAGDFAGLFASSNFNKQNAQSDNPVESAHSTSSRESSSSQEVPFVISTESTSQGSYTPYWKKPKKKWSFFEYIAQDFRRNKAAMLGVLAVTLLPIIGKHVGNYVRNHKKYQIPNTPSVNRNYTPPQSPDGRSLSLEGLSADYSNDPTVVYWNGYRAIFARCGQRIEGTKPSDNISLWITVFQSAIAEMRSLPTANVDPSLVTLVHDRATVLQKWVRGFQDIMNLAEQYPNSPLPEYEQRAWERREEQISQEIESLTAREWQIKSNLQRRFGERYIQ